MNANKACLTSLGRIGLLYRADLYTQRSTLLTLLGTIFLCLFFIPRIPLLFTWNYTEWALDYANSYIVAFDTMESFVSLVSVIAFWVYVNKRTQHTEPIIFSTTPARLREKVIAMGLYGITITVLSYVIVYVVEFLDWLTLPAFEFQWVGRVWYYSSYDMLIGAPTHVLISSGLIFMALYLSSMFLMTYLMMRIRNSFVGFLSFFAIVVVLGILGMVPVVAWFASLEPAYYMGAYSRGGSIYANVFTLPHIWGYITSFALLVTTARLCYKRLKTIPS